MVASWMFATSKRTKDDQRQFIREAFQEPGGQQVKALACGQNFDELAAGKTLDMIENTCYSFDGSESSEIKTSREDGTGDYRGVQPMESHDRGN